MSLGYYSPVQTGATARYSGDISSWAWAQAGQGTKSYGFSYDKAHRLTAGQFYDNGTATNAFSEKAITYDRAGNVTSLTRYNNSGSGTTLSYTYTGNRRSTFSYDVNGNVTSDAANSLQSSYNLINLPSQIKSGSTVKANYTYLSDGTKAAAYTSASAGKDYVGSFIYTRGTNNSHTLESVAFGGGRIRKTGTSSYAVDYHITDHLGSVRAIVNAAGAIQEQNDYYPFGTRHPNGLTQLSANRWRFSGKEEQDAFGIAYSDFGARLYDRTAAWTAIDPMAEKYYGISPYTYCSGNPVIFVDPNGRFAFIPILAKMAVGAIVDFGMQITFNMAAGASFEEALNKVDWTSVGASALIGPVSSAKNGAKLFSYAIAFADAGVDFSSEEGWTRIGGGKGGYEVAIDAISGIGSSEISDGIVKAFRKEYNALSKNASYMAPLTKAERETVRKRTAFVNSEGFNGFIQSLSQYAGGLVDKSFIELIKEGSLSGGVRGEPLELYYEQWIQQQQGPMIQQGF